jgi:hypothetical protein
VLLTGAVTDQALVLAGDGLWKPRTLTAALVGADASGAAAAAVGAHLLELDPHGDYALGGAIASSRLTMTGPGIVGRASGTGALQTLMLGSGLSIVGGVLTVTAGGAGTVTSVGLSLPAIFTVSGSPVEGAGTLTAVLATQTAGLVFAGPASGGAAAPTFRQLGYGELSGLPTLSNAAAQNLAASAAAGTSGDLARADHVHQFQPTDVMIPLLGDQVSLTNTTILTCPDWIRSIVITALPRWTLVTAPAGSAAQFDIRVGGVSIFATLPTIDATEQSSSTAAIPAVFSTPFINGTSPFTAPYTINAGTTVTFHCTQVGSTTAGAGLKVAIPTRRAS